MKIAILTSSRADYGIYMPLLRAFQKTEDIEYGLVVFGTHLSKLHGNTIENIEKDGFKILKKIDSLLINDTCNAISTSFALTAGKFADFWNEEGNNFDLVFALGDRFEMAAAVFAAVPFNLNIAHIHGGETTLGAIDNFYRHSISLASKMHFVSTEMYKERLQQLLGDVNASIYNVGSLSLENLDQIELLDLNQFEEEWKINLRIPTILVTVHPETVAVESNQLYCNEITEALQKLSANYQIVITLPNADTSGLMYRDSFRRLSNLNTGVYAVENFGTQSYFTCMKYSSLLIGNTSSGIIEAASFNKYVLNVGDRQKGRLKGDNVIDVPFYADKIIELTNKYVGHYYTGFNLYFKSQPAEQITQIIRNHLIC